LEVIMNIFAITDSHRPNQRIVQCSSYRRLASARYGHLPAELSRVNKHGAPVYVLIVQGIIVIVSSLDFVVFQDVQTTFFVLLVISVIPYMFAYLCMYAAALRLRYTQPDVKRDFRVPGGKIGIWVVGLVGSAACIAVLVQGVIPEEVPQGQKTMAAVLVVVVTILACVAPFLIDRKMPIEEEDWIDDSDITP
jgi:amino acid transporter